MLADGNRWWSCRVKDVACEFKTLSMHHCYKAQWHVCTQRHTRTHTPCQPITLTEAETVQLNRGFISYNYNLISYQANLLHNVNHLLWSTEQKHSSCDQGTVQCQSLHLNLGTNIKNYIKQKTLLKKVWKEPKGKCFVEKILKAWRLKKQQQNKVTVGIGCPMSYQGSVREYCTSYFPIRTGDTSLWPDFFSPFIS